MKKEKRFSKLKKSNVPMRKCVGCQESKPQSELRRIALYEGELTVDRSGRAKGRGIYLCLDPKCVEIARKKRAVIRGFKGQVSVENADKILEDFLND